MSCPLESLLLLPGKQAYLQNQDQWVLHFTLCRAMIRDNSTLNTTEYGGRWGVGQAGVPPEDHGTSHISVVGPDRMAVAITTTVNGGFGSKVFSKTTGGWLCGGGSCHDERWMKGGLA